MWGSWYHLLIFGTLALGFLSMVEVILQNEQTLLHQSSPKAHILWVFLNLVPEFCSCEAQTYDPATFVVSFALVET